MRGTTPAGRASTDAATSGPSGGRRRALRALFGCAVLVQLVVLYAPQGGGPGLLPGTDKVVHLLVFLVPVALALLAGLPRTPVVVVFAAQAVVSEVVQATLLPHRSGDPWDAVADLTGVALGVLVAHLLGRSRVAEVGGSRS